MWYGVQNMSKYDFDIKVQPLSTVWVIIYQYCMLSATEESVSVVYRVSEHDTECDTVQAVGVIVYVGSGWMYVGLAWIYIPLSQDYPYCLPSISAWYRVWYSAGSWSHRVRVVRVNVSTITTHHVSRGNYLATTPYSRGNTNKLGYNFRHFWLNWGFIYGILDTLVTKILFPKFKMWLNIWSLNLVL